jgi:S-formylglutathione hydrolase FrmB
VVKIGKEILRSSLMQRELPFWMILPENYEASKRNYPVLYLLHGLFGSSDNWLELTAIKNYLAGQELIVVLPEGGNNWYSDSATIEKDKFESSFINELIPTVEASYRTLASREKRAIAGLSMGGFGALKFALKRLDLFCFAGSMSGAFEAPQLTQNNKGFGWEELIPSILEVFGQETSAARAENDLFEIIRRLSGEKRSSFPYIYIDCGIDDGFLESNRKLATLLREKDIRFEYHEVAGGHDWNYWDQQIRVILEKVNKIFNQIKS